MSAEGKLGILDQINALATSSIEAYQQGDQALLAASAGTDEIVDLMSAAGNAINTSRAQGEQDYASVLNATTNTEQAHGLLVGLEFSNNAADAKTAEKQLAEAARLLGKITRGYVHLQQQLVHGIGAEIKNQQDTILHDVFGGIGLGRAAIRFDGTDSQQAIITASNNYKERLIKEQQDVTAGQQLLENANTALKPPEEETTTTEKKPTPESIVAELETIIANLGPLGPVLANFPQRLEMLKQMHEAAGSILMSWTTAPEDVKNTYRSIGEKLVNLTLPVPAESLNEHVGHITNSKKDIEAAKTEVENAAGFISWAREYILVAIHRLHKYLRRRS